MTRSTFPLLLLAAALAACSESAMPTQPAAPHRPAESLVLTGYTSRQLPLLPSGINYAGAIVGTVGSDAAHYANGTLRHLPRLTDAGGTYEAGGINSHGAIAGDVASGVGLFWRAADQVPYKIIRRTR